MKKLTKKYLEEQYALDLKSGMFFSTFPQMTGDFEKDLEEYKKVVKFRQEYAQEQERIAGLWERDINNAIATQNIIGKAPNERKIFALNEEVVVNHGGFISAYIQEVIEEGVYNVHITYETTKQYSKETHILTKNRVLGWWDIQKKVGKESPIMLGKDLRINFFQQDISSLLHRYIDDRGVDMNPPYQRGIVWSDEQRQELLNSIFNYIDIGKFVFIKLPYAQGGFDYQILDGKQKLQTLVDFYFDKFQWNGFYYSELNWEMKIVFMHHSVSVAELDGRSFDEKAVLEYFIKLNTTGVPMAKEHIEKVKKML